MVKVESSVPMPAEVAASIGWSTEVEPKDCGPVIEPFGPVIDRTWLGVNELTSIGRSKVTWYWLLVSLTSKSWLSVPPLTTCPEVPMTAVETTCGPGTISGRVFWLNGGVRMLWAVVKVIGTVGSGRGHRVDVARRQARASGVTSGF